LLPASAQRSDRAVRVFARKPPDRTPLRLRVFCFAHAGAGAPIFRSWPEHLPPGIELACPSLPGRDARAAEAPQADMKALVAGVAAEVLPLLDAPYCLFGHSLGAFVAFDLAHELAQRRMPPPRHLFVAAQRAPRLPHPQVPIYHLPDAAFLDGVQQRHAALPAALLADPDMRRYLTHLLRADFTLVETYRHRGHAALACAVTAFGGRDDDAVPPALLPGWAEETTGPCEIVLLPGGHFFFKSHAREFLAEFSVRLAGAMPPAG
jgi:medium-chain acyl-[acyl-carrier-protein] hydrolase